MKLEKEIGFDIKIFKATVRKPAPSPETISAVLHAQLRSLAHLGDRVAVLFDEFQRLRRCPGQPLSIVRSALLGTKTPNVSLLVTGSVREGLELMVKDSREPLFQQAVNKQLPSIPGHLFVEYLELNFQATQKQITPDASELIVDLCSAHPKRTQQLAHRVWSHHQCDEKTIQPEDVLCAHEQLLASEAPDFRDLYSQLADGTEADLNEARALFLLASEGSERLSSRSIAEHYGFTSHTAPAAAAERLHKRGLVTLENGGWRVVDPLLADWLKKTNPLELKSSDLS